MGERAAKVSTVLGELRLFLLHVKQIGHVDLVECARAEEILGDRVVVRALLTEFWRWQERLAMLVFKVVQDRVGKADLVAFRAMDRRQRLPRGHKAQNLRQLCAVVWEEMEKGGEQRYFKRSQVGGWEGGVHSHPLRSCNRWGRPGCGAARQKPNGKDGQGSSFGRPHSELLKDE